MPTPQKPTPEELRNRRNIAKAQKAIREEYNHAIDEIFKSAVNIKFTADTFRLSDNPALQRKVNEVMKRFRLRVETTLVNAIQTSFLISQENFRNTVYGAYDGRAINDQIKAILNATYDRPMQAFLNRTQSGLKLSDRVWNLSTQFQREIEETIFAGLSNGRSAQEMARDLKRYLNDPDRLFRRVRNAKGRLVLSKAAKEFKPGQGVYRSSRKNAMRLSRTEINMAYRTADHNQYANTKFVLGIEVRLSDMHQIFDVCDHLAGVYPSSFKFVSWHPQCICYQVPILPSKAEFDAYQEAMLRGEDANFKFTGVIKEIPRSAVQWFENNKERIKGWKSTPYFIRDNRKVFSLG